MTTQNAERQGFRDKRQTVGVKRPNHLVANVRPTQIQRIECGETVCATGQHLQHVCIDARYGVLLAVVRVHGAAGMARQRRENVNLTVHTAISQLLFVCSYSFSSPDSRSKIF